MVATFAHRATPPKVMHTMRFLSRLFGTGQVLPPDPVAPLIVVGDIHGRADLLEELIGLLAKHADTQATLVFVGDYIDRGETSADVLGLLQALQDSIWPGTVICLQGNHEAMMLDFLDRPEEAGAFWLPNGGAHTLASYGIHPPDMSPGPLLDARDALCDALRPRTQSWLRSLPLSHQSGNVFIAHAGADPHAPLDRQDATHLLWGHPEFATTPRRDGAWVAHGHTIQDQASAENGRIGVDTGAYATHRLTAALVSRGTCHFIATGGSQPG
jgi:serine/threonine protein phosphatase 1